MNFLKNYFGAILMARISFQKYEFTESSGYNTILGTMLTTFGITSAVLIIFIKNILNIKIPKIFAIIIFLLVYFMAALFINNLKKKDFFNNLKEKCNLLSDDEIRHIRIVGICKFLIALTIPLIAMLLLSI